MNRLRRALCLSLTLLSFAAASQALAADKASPEAIPLSGTVAETMDGGGYTYILLKTASGEKKWVAAPQMKVSKGQQLSLMPGYEMTNFSSKKLNRTFDKIVFSGGPAAQNEVRMSPEAIKNAHKGLNLPGAAPAAKGNAAAKAAGPAHAASKSAVASGKVAKAKGANAYTVGDLWANRAKLEKKTVVVRGRVTKVSERILKHNWVHLEDGTGSAAKKTNSIVVTTKALPKEGDIVTAKGLLKNRIDFGAGYKYELILLDANMR